MTDVIVIGGNHHNTLSILRSLGQIQCRSKEFGNINLICVSNSKNPYIKYSKYISNYECIDDEETLPSLLISKYQKKEKPIIITCSDAIASCIDLNRNILSKHFKIPGASIQGGITNLMNKSAMAQLALTSGLNIPYYIDSKITDLNYDILSKLTYPCITKPLVSKDGNKTDIHIFHNSEEFYLRLKDFRCQEIQIQEYIEKDIEYQLIGCSLNGGNIVIIPGASIILRQPENTNTGFLKYVTNFNADYDACQNFLKSSDFSGLFSMEFIRGKDGKDYFMEINFRNDGNAICVTAAGMNLPYIWFLFNIEKNVHTYINSCKMKDVLVMPEFNDFKNVLNHSISFYDWLRDVKRTDCFMEFCRDDQKPFWAYIAQKLKIIHS